MILTKHLKSCACSSSVSLFGPGVGESICLDLGNGDWFIIDSCLDPLAKRPAALVYLEGLGLDPAVVVKGVVVSHWHDDHVKGMAEIVRTCDKAKVFVSVALQNREFYQLIHIYNGRSSSRDRNPNTGVDELKSVFEILKRKIEMSNQEKNEMPLNFVGPDARIYSDGEVEIFTLSPSNGSILSAFDNFSDILNEAKASPKIIPRPSSNFCAVALHVKFKGDVVAILGADLETSKGNSLIGWDAVLNSSTKPQAKAKFVKVPHHGSATGHHPAFWSDMVEVAPVAILTEYSPSRLPRDNDVDRLKALTSELFCTTVPKGRLPKREKTVDRAMSEVTKQRRPLTAKTIGRVTLNIDEHGGYEVDLGENSRKL